jgi:hypothetical protein
MPGIKSSRQIWGRDFVVGSEWDAGSTPPHLHPEQAGRWTVRREAECFTVVFHSFHTGQETLLDAFAPSEQGELDAKACALAARDTLRFS